MNYIPLVPKFIPTIGNLPTSYDESLSYLQMLMTLRKNLNIAINTINELTKVINNIDYNFEDIYNKIDDINNQINSILPAVNQQLQNYNNQILLLMNDYQIIFNNNLLQLKNELEEEIERIELGDVKAYDPTTGTYVNVSTAILNVYETLRNNAVTCTEFDGLELTATEYDALEITAYNFDVNGKEFLNVA